MRKKFRFLTVLAVCVMVLSCFSVTAFAYADDTEQNLPVTEATQPEQQPAVTPTPEKPKGEPIDDEGNAYTRDLLYDKATNKQFITVQTKNGNTFFIVIDYDAPINEDEEQYQTYSFLFRTRILIAPYCSPQKSEAISVTTPTPHM